MGVRSKETQAAYDNFRAAYEGVCIVCDVHERAPKVVLDDSTSMIVMDNEYPYNKWDSRGVSDHKMIAPKRHVLSFAGFNEKEIIDYFKLVAHYETEGYSIYTRSPGNMMRTVGHLHTHLFKLSDQA